MTEGLDFIAIDFETATGKRTQIAECSRHHIPLLHAAQAMVVTFPLHIFEFSKPSYYIIAVIKPSKPCDAQAIANKKYGKRN